MKQFIPNNRADAPYIYFIMLLALVAGGIIYAIFIPMVNHLTESNNNAVANGDISEQTAQNYDWANRVFKYILPVAYVLIIGSWGYTKTNLEEI